MVDYFSRCFSYMIGGVMCWNITNQGQCQRVYLHTIITTLAEQRTSFTQCTTESRSRTTPYVNPRLVRVARRPWYLSVSTCLADLHSKTPAIHPKQRNVLHKERHHVPCCQCHHSGTVDAAALYTLGDLSEWPGNPIPRYTSLYNLSEWRQVLATM
ncbi:hypothetical protein BS50DRAFT_413896 [Corynespora cassiicola Philippines]|uniref:Uncharacterized protein n=1 Tax=Corynespora cassiicola Philippines TaxID=1448308 RepID=A0A2T2NLY0_CORCC|nr:hypothetical protein BS50DRAFT_413896 [Corynespora cassiicola Philippines]